MIYIYDSLKGEKVKFEKTKGETVKMYVCGPTVYDNAHLGHGRSALAFDMIRRSLNFWGYPVTFTFNITDIDDKMIVRAKEKNISVPELADLIIPEYAADYAALGILPPSHNPKATEFVKEMIEIIEDLEKQGVTYTLDDGVYFDISRFPAYGKLSHQKMDELNAGSRVKEHKDKRNHQDFVLWKFKKTDEPYWESPWGQGRPGWHIECSAMSKSILGDYFDIHGGGLDLKFPHHECEIAQNESLASPVKVGIWMHNGYITVDQEKMSKSLNNFFTLKDIFQKFHPRVVRFFLLGTHYRSPIEFSDASLTNAANTLKGLDSFFLKHKANQSEKNANAELDQNFLNEFSEILKQDFDMPGALAGLFEWINSEPENPIATLLHLNEILNIFPVDFHLNANQEEKIALRNIARSEKNWRKADALRDDLLKDGIELEDDENGTISKPAIFQKYDQ